jgi:hypothetical protein
MMRLITIILIWFGLVWFLKLHNCHAFRFQFLPS